MTSFNRRFVLVLVTALLLFGSSAVIHAQDLTPAEQAGSLRKTLFNAQTALAVDDATAATQQTSAAQAVYRDALANAIRETAPAVDAQITTAFATATNAVSAKDSAAFAAARAHLWTALLNGSAQVTLRAVEKGDVATAQAWFDLREFRASSKFSRPGADGALALDALAAGKLSAADAAAAVRTDLLDAYQARLNQVLADADSAARKTYTIKQAEAAGAAAGYFDILSAAYSTQRGAQAAQAGAGTFDALVQTALIGSPTEFTARRAEVDALLKGFRAAPLSQAEIERRAGQLLRYVSLVDIEYARGVRDGKVVKDLEIQEANTFREGAVAAFIDLQPSLEARNPTLTAQVAAQISSLKSLMDAVADPNTVADTVSKIGDNLGTLLPAEWLKSASASDFDVIYSVLDQVLPAVKQDQYASAENARIEAYAIIDSGIEKKLRGFAPDIAGRIESTFWTGEAGKPGLAILLANHAPASEIQAALTRLRGYMSEGQNVMASFKSAPGAVVGNAAVIVFREGLEAVLILASLIASLRTVETKKFRKPIFIGAGLAFVASIITWIIANGIITALSKYGEKLEAIVGIIAVGVLLVITNWFFHKTYWTGWMANFHQQKNKIIGGAVSVGPFIALILLGFTSIYREGFETVLFLQSLVLEAGLSIVVQGVGIGLFFTGIVGVIAFSLQTKLPYKKMLIVTGVFIGVVLVSMVGKTVFALQASGWLTIHPLPGIYFPYWMGQWFGLYATWEGIFLQIASAAFVIGSYLLAEHQNARKRVGVQSRKSVAKTA